MSPREAVGAGRFPVITAAGVEALRRLIGVPITDTVEPWCYEATRDTIRHYAHGIGDDNPLWCDPAYAASTGHSTGQGRLLAPPSFVFALSRILSGYVGGLPGIHAMWAGADLAWHRPIVQGDEFLATARLKELVEHETRFAGRAIQQIYHVELVNQWEELVCAGDSWCFRTERDTARELGVKYDEVKLRPEVRYGDDELKRIWDSYASENRRGPDPRYVEDVAVGDALPPMVKGPMTVTGFIAFAQGWGGLYIRANRLAWKQLRDHVALGIPNRFGIPDIPERVHWENDLARAVGTPAAYDYGPERCSWLIHHLTDWMGDDGSLRKHRCEIRRHNPVGDTLFISGHVSGFQAGDDGLPLVEVTQTAVNQDHELSATGLGVVRLPSRASRPT